MVEQFEASGHPVFKGVSPLARGILRKKNNKETIHFSADASNTALSDRTIHFANQVSTHGAVARWCDDFEMPSPQQETVCVKFNRTSEHWERTSNLQEFVMKRHPSMKLLWEKFTEQP